MASNRRADSLWVSSFTEVTPGFIRRKGGAGSASGHGWAVPDLLEETEALLRLSVRWSTADAQVAGRIQAKLPAFDAADPWASDGHQLREALRDCVYWLGERILANSGKLSAQDVSQLTGLPVENFKTREQLEQSVANLVKDMADNIGRTIAPAKNWLSTALWIGGGLAALYVFVNARRGRASKEE